MKRGNKIIKFTFLFIFICLNLLSYGQTPCLDIQIMDLACISDATSTNPFDDSYTFDIIVNGGSSGWKAEIGDTLMSGAYGMTMSSRTFSIVNGPLFLLVDNYLC